MLAERGDADLMVLGLRTHSFLEAMVTGSTTEWVLHHPISPLVVASSADPVHRVVVCVDGSGHADAAVAAFARLPLATEATVTALSVDDGRTETTPALERVQHQLTGRVREIETVTLSGTPTRAILDHLEQSAPDLVVLGTRGLTGWQPLRLGSTASAIVRSAPCSSLVASGDTARLDDLGGE